MFNNPLLPTLNNGSSTKSNIISILSHKYPLSKTKIYNEIKKNSGITFHAVNKAVNELHNHKIISKRGKEYLPDYEWLKDLHEFSSKAISRLKDEKGNLMYGVKEMKKEGNVITLTFDNLFDMDYHCKELYDLYYSRLKDEDKVCMVYRHHWWHLLYPTKEYPSKLKNKNFFCIGIKNNPLDKSSVKFKKMIGMKVIYKKNYPFVGYTIYGDVVMQVVMSQNIIDALDKFFLKYKNLEEFPGAKKFIDTVLKKKGNIIVIINQNKELAKEIRESILRLF